MTTASAAADNPSLENGPIKGNGTARPRIQARLLAFRAMTIRGNLAAAAVTAGVILLSAGCSSSAPAAPTSNQVKASAQARPGRLDGGGARGPGEPQGHGEDARRGDVPGRMGQPAALGAEAAAARDVDARLRGPRSPLAQLPYDKGPGRLWFTCRSLI